MLPRARQTNQLPPALYADNLKVFGVQMSPREVMERALADYAQTRDELEVTAAALAQQRGWPSGDYRDVIRSLKKERIPQDQLLALYQGRLQQIEEIVRRERIRIELALPGRFDALAFHDFIVNQGLLPFELLEQAVMDELVNKK